MFSLLRSKVLAFLKRAIKCSGAQEKHGSTSITFYIHHHEVFQEIGYGTIQLPPQKRLDLFQFAYHCNRLLARAISLTLHSLLWTI